MPSPAQLKKDLTPLVLVGKGALGKLSAEDLLLLSELVKQNKLTQLCIDVTSKRLVKLTARVNVTEVKGTEHLKGLGEFKDLYLQYGNAGVVKEFESGFFDGFESVRFQAGVVAQIPPELLFQPKLRVLEIHNTPVKLPEKVNWPKLESLLLGAAGPTLPECLVLRTLTSFAISADESKLKTLPENIGDMDKLVQLNLTNNKLTTLPASMAKLQNLRHLMLTGNKLKALPDWLANLRLETLSVDNPLPASLQHLG